MIYYENRILSTAVVPKGESIYSDRAKIITIIDEAGGEFIEIKQGNDQKIFIEPDEWQKLRQGIESMLQLCRRETED